MKTVIIQVPMIAEISEEEFNTGSADVDFGGGQLIQIQKHSDGWFVSNAANGHGFNNFEVYKNSKVEIV